MLAKFGHRFKRLLRDDVEKYCKVSREIYELRATSFTDKNEAFKFYSESIEKILVKYYPEIMKQHEIIFKESNNTKRGTVYLISLTKKRIV